MTAAAYSPPFTTAGFHYRKNPTTNARTGGLKTTVCVACQAGDCQACKAPREAMELVRSSGDPDPLPRRPVCVCNCHPRRT